MTAPAATVALSDLFARDLPELCLPWRADPAPAPQLLVLDEEVAVELGLDPAWLRTPAGLGLLTGTEPPAGAHPVAQAYAGHQFGGYSPRLGDGRALLLGELADRKGRLRDLHLKGSGRTPFSRGGDGLAALGPMLREHLIGTAMHALGIPTTRALAVVATGRTVQRETPLPGAVLARVASSHLRVGTVQYAAALAAESGETGVLERLVRHALQRHHPGALEGPYAEAPALALLDAVVAAQASLVARWLGVGFVHGVMNTDNTTLSGETIDYGPCAFLDAFDPAAVFSSIDEGGRYAYGRQPGILHWNLARLAESLLALVRGEGDEPVAAVTAILDTYPARFRAAWVAEVRRKLGLVSDREGDEALVEATIGLLAEQRVDLTGFFRALGGFPGGDEDAAAAWVLDRAAFDRWAALYRARLAVEGRPGAAVAAALAAANPAYVPRNHLVEEALAAAAEGDLTAYERLLGAVRAPYDVRPGLERYAAPAPASFTERYRTFCGT